jgi:hypothetical protein
MVELLITMAVFVFAIAATSTIFVPLLNQFKQQSKISETNVEGIVGLEIFRRDILHAGYGLPWIIPSNIAYNETAGTTYNDCSGSAPCNPPRAILSGDNVNPGGGILSGTDYLVIKEINITDSPTSQRSTNLQAGTITATLPGNPRLWSNANENLQDTDHVIVLSMSSSNVRGLVTSGTNFSTTYNSVKSSTWQPLDTAEIRVVYGVDPGNNLRMPFNRADYYVKVPSSANMPQRCAPHTGILYKATVNHDSTGSYSELPLLDCVADMQVKYFLDTNGDGNIDWPPVDDIAAYLTAAGYTPAQQAEQIRNQVKEIRVYIVAQEGQKDWNYDFSMNGTRKFLSTLVLSPNYNVDHNSSTVYFADLSTLVGDPEYKYYRWKLYTIIAKPIDLE